MLEGVMNRLSVPASILRSGANLVRKMKNPIGCTTLVAVPPATKDGKVYLLWNFDLLTPIKPVVDRFRFFVTQDEGGFKYVAWGIPRLLHFGLMNQYGLSFVGNVVGMTDGGTNGSISFEMVNRAMSTCKNPAEVAALFEKTRRHALAGFSANVMANLNTMWADPSGNAVTIEYSRNHVIAVPVGPEGVMVSSNHHQYLDRSLTGSVDPSQQHAIAGSYVRLDRAWELAKELAEARDIDFAKVLMFATDHRRNNHVLDQYGFLIPESGMVDDSTLCVHFDNLPHYLRRREFVKLIDMVAEGETLKSFIIDPQERTIWFCDGKPCEKGYVGLNFTDQLARGPYQPTTLQKGPFLTLIGALEWLFPIK